MDYRFNYARTPESALKYRIAQWVSADYSSNRLRKKVYLKAYDTREEAEAVASKLNEELCRLCPFTKYEAAE